jgi:Uma2 family endonuclease
MVTIGAPKRRYTRAEYIAFERSSSTRNEFFDGVIYAMAGGSREHALYAANVIALLGAELRSKPCSTHTADLRIRILATGLDTYPDVSVVCGSVERDPEDEHAILNPTLVVEVTSPSTADYDRGDKLAHYQEIPSLGEVVIVDYREKLVEVHRRESDGSWRRYEARSGAAATLASLGVELSVDAIYRDPLASTPV